MRVIRVFAAILFVAAAGLYAGQALATQVAPVNVSGLLKAELAFRGTCTGAETYIMYHTKVPRGLLVTTYTFSVPGDGVIEGDVPETMSFTQWGAPRVESMKFNAPFVIGMPTYEVGKEYTVFLTSVSELGLRSTIGLGYGMFKVTMDPGGNRMVVNNYNNRGLFRGLTAMPSVTKALNAAGVPSKRPVTGAIGYDDFRTIIDKLQRRR
jgi:hypothetical protein